MRVTTDHYFSIGKRHQNAGMPCQDYALSGSVGDTTFAVVSDGCSSGGHTDLGARAYAFDIPASLRESREPGVDAYVRTFAETLGLCRDDMLATQVAAYWNGAQCDIHLRGDGVIAVAYEGDGVTHREVHRIEWEGNTPYYPTYAWDDMDLDRFNDLYQGQTYVATRESWYDRTGAAYDHHEMVSYDMNSVTPSYRLIVPRKKLERGPWTIAVFTDGVTQLMSPEGRTVPWQDTVRRFLDFRTTKGAFAKRRMARELDRYARDSIVPMDDIGYAVIRGDADLDTKENEHGNRCDHANDQRNA